MSTAPTLPLINHRDYRIVFNDTMNKARQDFDKAGNRSSWWIQHRDDFENLHNEIPIASLIRGLGNYETDHYNRIGHVLADNYVLGPCWLTILFEVRRLLNGDVGKMDSGLLSQMLFDLGLNAGFSPKELGE